ncbi:MAG TPA: hypothetical protein VFB62_25815 [Polyangiaceae bacterium]|nr:hypothetical protein [Polyangiaceae bacterium]
MKKLTLSSLYWALVVVSGCFVPPASSDDDDGSSSEPGIASEPSNGGSCRGGVWECHYLDDIPSCTYQQGCSWSFEVDDCNGHQTACENLDDKGLCIRQIGCEWVDENGNVESSLLEGDCIGTPTPCESYMDQSSCNTQPGCTWGYSAGCETDYGEVSIGQGCEAWSVHDIDVDGHPSVTMGRCEARDGCSWDGDRYSDETGGAGPGAPSGP